MSLLLTPKEAARVPKLLIYLGRRYVPYVNRTYKRTGTLWDSRYKSGSMPFQVEKRGFTQQGSGGCRAVPADA